MDVTPADKDDDDAAEDEDDEASAEERLRRRGMTAAALVAISATCQLFAHVGREFCGGGDSSSISGGGGAGGASASAAAPGGGFDGSGRLEGCLRLRAKAFFAACHARELATAKHLAASDAWARCNLALPPPPLPGPNRPGANRGRVPTAAVAPGGGSAAWDTGVPASDVASTVRVLAAEHPNAPSRASTPLACSARQHAAVRRLVAARRPKVHWPPAVQRLPAVCVLMNDTPRHTRTQHT